VIMMKLQIHITGIFSMIT